MCTATGGMVARMTISASHAGGTQNSAFAAYKTEIMAEMKIAYSG